jgi:hypothetical protein
MSSEKLKRSRNVCCVGGAAGRRVKPVCTPVRWLESRKWRRRRRKALIAIKDEAIAK